MLDLQSYNTPPEEANESKPPISYGLVLIGFSILCFVTSWWFSFDQGKAIQFRTSFMGSPVGHPFKVPEDNSVYLATISQSSANLADNSGWSDIEIEIMDQEEETLFSFGGDIWRASGYDEGHWAENKNKFKMKFTIPLKGDYLIGVKAENNAGRAHNFNAPISVNIQPKVASSLPLMITGIFAFIGGIIIGYINNKKAINETLAAMSEES